jgi:hypothetical protein
LQRARRHDETGARGKIAKGKRSRGQGGKKARRQEGREEEQRPESREQREQTAEHRNQSEGISTHTHAGNMGCAASQDNIVLLAPLNEATTETERTTTDMTNGDEVSFLTLILLNPTSL